MSGQHQPVQGGGVIRNALAHYHAELRSAARHVAGQRGEQPPIPLELPGDMAPFAGFTAVSDLALSAVDDQVYLLDLMRNPGTRTTKTLASLLMIARAVAHLRRTGERVLVLTPTSGNKGTALRDAVARAHAAGLASPDELRIATVVPAASQDEAAGLPAGRGQVSRTANPLVLAKVDAAADVKRFGAEVVRSHAAELLADTGFRLWYTLDLDNYRIADAARAFAEADLLPLTAASRPRVHLHAVSSAFGLLGYHLGHRLLTDGVGGWPAPARHPGFFLVQHLATPDMVTSLLGVKVPEYHQEDDGLWHAGLGPGVPVGDRIAGRGRRPDLLHEGPADLGGDRTTIVERHGGGGVVVSLRECLDRFDRVRAIAGRAGIVVDADPARVREWSLVMVLTGMLVARERGLLPADTDVVVHASGYYNDELVPPARDEHLAHVGTADELADVVRAAARA